MKATSTGSNESPGQAPENAAAGDECHSPNLRSAQLVADLVAPKYPKMRCVGWSWPPSLKYQEAALF